MGDVPRESYDPVWFGGKEEQESGEYPILAQPSGGTGTLGTGKKKQKSKSGKAVTGKFGCGSRDSIELLDEQSPVIDSTKRVITSKASDSLLRATAKTFSPKKKKPAAETRFNETKICLETDRHVIGDNLMRYEMTTGIGGIGHCVGGYQAPYAGDLEYNGGYGMRHNPYYGHGCRRGRGRATPGRYSATSKQVGRGKERHMRSTSDMTSASFASYACDPAYGGGYGMPPFVSTHDHVYNCAVTDKRTDYTKPYQTAFWRSLPSEIHRVEDIPFEYNKPPQLGSQ